MNEILTSVLTIAFLSSVLRVTTPILFATLGSVVAERAGTPNIALEAIMLFAALFGALGSGLSGSLMLGFLCAMVGGMIVTSMLIIFALKLKADIILTGIALNLLAVGGTVFIMYTMIQDKGSTTSIATQVFPRVYIPFLSSVPVLGGLLNDHNVLTYVAFVMVIVIYVLLFKMRIGMRIRAVGENAGAAASVGVNVFRTQVYALIISGLLASMGGAFMSMGFMNGFSQNMVAGRGFIALAAAAMGQLHPVWGMVAALVFGAADALAIVMATMRIPDELVRMIPYLTTIVGLVIFSAMNKRLKDIRKKKIMEEKTA